MKKLNRLLTLMIAVFLTGCGPGNLRQEQPVTAFELQRDITIPANQAHVVFQYGKAMRGKNLFEWHCELEIDTVRESPQRIQADSLLVTRQNSRVVRDEQTGMPLMPFAGLACGERYYETHYWLHSETQPGIRKMICRNGHHFCSDEDFITREEMKGVFGSWVTVR